MKDRLAEDTVMELSIQMHAWNAAVRGQGINPMHGFIQSLAHTPFHVIYFTERQLHVFVDASRSKTGCVLHIDSTGSVIKKIPNQKDPLLYSLFLANHGIPIMEFITTDHRSISISAKLDFFMAACRDHANNGRPILPSMVVMDFSYATINAVLICFNKMSLTAYLHATYEMLTTGKSMNFLVVIALCCAHVMKAISNR